MASPHEHRDGRGRFTRGVDSVERDAEAFRLKSRGWSLSQISDELGYGGKQNVSRAINRAEADILTPAVETYRRLQLAAIDEALRVVFEVMDAEHPLVSQGGQVVFDKTDDGTPVKLYDDGPRLAAVRELRALLERQAKTLGSDAPARRVVTLDDLNAERARLLAEESEYDEEDDVDEELDEDESESDDA